MVVTVRVGPVLKGIIFGLGGSLAREGSYFGLGLEGVQLRLQLRLRLRLRTQLSYSHSYVHGQEINIVELRCSRC